MTVNVIVCRFDSHLRIWNIYLNLYLRAALSSASQHAMPPKFALKWRMQCLNTRFPLPTLLCIEYGVKPIDFRLWARSCATHHIFIVAKLNTTLCLKEVKIIVNIIIYFIEIEHTTITYIVRLAHCTNIFLYENLFLNAISFMYAIRWYICLHMAAKFTMLCKLTWHTCL